MYLTTFILLETNMHACMVGYNIYYAQLLFMTTDFLSYKTMKLINGYLKNYFNKFYR